MKGDLLKEHQRFGGVEESLLSVVTNEKCKSNVLPSRCRNDSIRVNKGHSLLLAYGHPSS